MSDHTHSFMTHGYPNASHDHGHGVSYLQRGPSPVSYDHIPVGHWQQSYGTVNISGVLNKQLEAAIKDMQVNLTKQIFSENVLLDRLNQQAKEQPMSTIDKITNERREARERQEVEAKFNHWEQLIRDPEEGAVITYTKTVDEKVVRYVAIFTNEKWQTSRNGEYDVEGFIRLLIVSDIETTDLAYMEPIE